MKRIFSLTVTFKAGDGGSGVLIFADTEQQACDKYREFRPDTTEIRGEEVTRSVAVKMLGFCNQDLLKHRITRIQLSEHPKAEKIIAFLELAEEMHKRAAETFLGD